jgi:predicted nucleotidyltransferase
MSNLDSIKPVLDELKRELVLLYGQRLRQMILYGSYARGDAQEDSDVDVLLILQDVHDPLAEREQLSEMIWQLVLEHGIVISVLPVDAALYANRQKPLFLNVRREGVLI